MHSCPRAAGLYNLILFRGLFLSDIMGRKGLVEAVLIVPLFQLSSGYLRASKVRASTRQTHDRLSLLKTVILPTASVIGKDVPPW